MGLRIPMARAEKLKTEEGSCVLGNSLPGEMILLKDDSGFAGKEIERETLNTIIHLRLREAFELLKRRLKRNRISAIWAPAFSLLAAAVS
jgi:cell division protein FtsA